mgnify:CR=1 FL=1
MGKQIFYGDDARQRVLKGAEMLYDAVKVTLSPKGGNVVIKKNYGITVTHDGVTVAENVDLPDTPETLGYSVGADLIKEASSKLNKMVGDGTTSVTVLTYNIMAEANKLIAAGYSPMEIRQHLEAVGKELQKKLEKLIVTVDDKKIEHVATISAGSAELGKLIAAVANQIGKDGKITVEAGKGFEVESEIRDGFTFDRGYFSPFFMTDKARQEAIIENPAVYVTNKKLKSAEDLLAIVKPLAELKKKDLVIIADDMDGEALNLLVLNKLKGMYNVVAVKAPAFGENRRPALEDVSTVTGSEFIDEMTLESTEMFGTADKVIVTKDSCTIINGGGNATDIKERIAGLEAELKTAESEYEKDILCGRIANIHGKVAVIKVGGASETEIDEKKYRVDDAVAAVKAAMDGGIVAGGGVTLVNLADSITIKGSEVEKATRRGLARAMQQPFINIMKNASFNSETLLAAVQGAEPGIGVNVMKGTDLINMIEGGVIDPANVTKEVISSSISIASTAITMGALVIEETE